MQWHLILVGSVYGAVLALEVLRCLLDIFELCEWLTASVALWWSIHLLQGVLVHFRLQKLDRPYKVFLLFKH
jgi:hypothetical protein